MGNEQSPETEAFRKVLRLSGETYQIPNDIREWLGHRLLLYAIPFNYLVPEEDMLPPESIRFFYLDPGWMKCLLEGACSVGRSSTVDEVLDQHLRNNFFNLAEEEAGELRPKANGERGGQKKRLNWPLTGFLIRSVVVEGWPGLEMKAKGVDALGNIIDPLEPLRIDRLNPEIMLCIFNGKVTEIEIKQPPEGMHFGASPAGGNVYKKLHLRRLFAADPAEPGDQIPESKVPATKVPMREDVERVVNIRSLADEMAEKLTNAKAIDGPFTSAEFGVQMVESPGRVIFTVNEGK
jgi:hypothetical protein